MSDTPFIPPFIYALSDPRAPKHYRYVGMTETDSLRPYRHRVATGNAYRDRWIRRLQSKGLDYIVTILEYFSVDTPREDVCQAECDFIQLLRERGDKLTNETPGGDGIAKGTVFTALHRRNLAEASRRQKRRPHTAETKIKMSLSSMGVPQGPMPAVQKQKISDALKGRNKPLGFGKKVSAGLKAFNNDPANQPKIRERKAAAWVTRKANAKALLLVKAEDK